MKFLLAALLMAIAVDLGGIAKERNSKDRKDQLKHVTKKVQLREVQKEEEQGAKNWNKFTLVKSAIDIKNALPSTLI